MPLREPLEKHILHLTLQRNRALTTQPITSPTPFLHTHTPNCAPSSPHYGYQNPHPQLPYIKNWQRTEGNECPPHEPKFCCALLGEQYPNRIPGSHRIYSLNLATSLTSPWNVLGLPTKSFLGKESQASAWILFGNKISFQRLLATECFRGWIRPPCGKMLSWICNICLGHGKESGTFCHPQWGAFSGIVSFNPHNFLYNAYQPHLINQDLSVLHSEGRGCLMSERWGTPLMNNFASKTPTSLTGSFLDMHPRCSAFHLPSTGVTPASHLRILSVSLTR